MLSFIRRNENRNFQTKEAVNMKKIVIAVMFVVLASWVVFPSLSLSKPEFAKETGEPCKTCHVKPIKGDENLTDVGKCFKAKATKTKEDLAACKK